MASTERTIETILEKVRETRNFDFRNYKRATLYRRIERRMTDRGLKSHADYLKFLERNPEEFDALISGMLIKVTSFFRDRELWDHLSQRVIPLILANKRQGEEVRVWSAGCSTGEEAFSIAILLAEALGPAFGSYDVKVFGTDLAESAIAFARRGIFSADQIKAVPKPLLARWFGRVADGYTLKQEIRRLLVFGVNNLVSDAPISRLDLLICRNVFIYLDATLQKRVLSRFHYALSSGGVLVLGKAELIPFAGRLFEQVDLGLRIYRKDGRVDVSGLPAGPSLLDGGAYDGLARVRESEDAPVAGNWHRDALEASPIALIATGIDGAILVWNAASSRLWGLPEHDALGKKLTALGLPGLSAEDVAAKSSLVREGKRERQLIEANVSNRGQTSNAITLELLPLRAGGGDEITGVLYVVTDVTALRSLEAEMRQASQDLRSSNLKLQRSVEELRASNEELETTNEELQSANEELQTTNEELQSTNEELETTNEELQSANAELDTTNRELAHRTEQMHVMGLYQRTIIRSLSAGIVVIDNKGLITAWNLAAERLLGLPEAEAVGQTLWTLRIPAISRPLIQKVRKAIGERRAFRDEDVSYELPTGAKGKAVMVAMPLADGERSLGGVLLFEDNTRSILLADENQRLKELIGGKKQVAAKKIEAHGSRRKPAGRRRG